MQLGAITEQRIDQSGPQPGGEFVYVDISSVDNESKRIAGSKRLRVEAAPSRARLRLRAGDVLVSMTRPNLNAVALVPNELDGAIGSTGLHVLRARSDVLPQWLYYGVQSRRFVGIMSELVQGALYPAVRPKDIRAFELPVPKLGEQRSIVAEIEKQFSRLDEAVANLKRVKANLDRYRSCVLAEAVTQWPVTPLRAVLREPLRNGHSAKATGTGEGLRAFTLSAVTENDFSVKNTKMTVAEPRKVADLWAVSGDIYVERSNTPELVGTAALYRGPENFAFIPDLLIRVRVSTDVLPEWAEIALKSETGRRYFRKRAQGISGTMPKIDQSAVEEFPLPLPPIAEQRRIVSEVDRRLSIVREVEAEVDANLKRAQALRQAVLARAFAVANEAVPSPA